MNSNTDITFLSYSQHKISPVPPSEYGDRFFAFMKAIMRGGEGLERFMVKRDKEKEKAIEGQEQAGQEKENEVGRDDKNRSAIGNEPEKEKQA